MSDLIPKHFFAKLFLVSCIFIFLPELVTGQSCLNLFELTKNARYEYELLDKKNKRIGLVRNMVLSAETDSAQTKLVIKSGVYGPKNNLEHTTDFTLRCRNDSVYYDKMLLLDHENLKSFKGKEMTFEGTDLVWPLTPVSGQKLPDGNLLVTVKVFNRPVATINHRVYDRQVAGTEDVTTGAGTFTCFTINYKYEVVTTAIGISLKKRDYGIACFSPEQGLIKTQFTNKTGKRKLHSIVLRSRTNIP